MSNLIKSSYYIPMNDRKLIEVLQSRMAESGRTLPGLSLLESGEEAVEEARRQREQLLEEAKREADALLAAAKEEAEQMKLQAQEEIHTWWSERREADARIIAEAKQEGFLAGHAEGAESARNQVRDEHRDLLDRARDVVGEAYEAKDRIIQEAEPFLVELSSAVAAKILGRELQADPRWTSRFVKRLLVRRRWKGAVSVCVAPDRFPAIHRQRDELAAALNGEAELQVLPDPSVQDEGCLIRTEYGTLDARIDSQLKEIKSTLRKVAIGAGGKP